MIRKAVRGQAWRGKLPRGSGVVQEVKNRPIRPGLGLAVWRGLGYFLRIRRPHCPSGHRKCVWWMKMGVQLRRRHPHVPPLTTFHASQSPPNRRLSPANLTGKNWRSCAGNCHAACVLRLLCSSAAFLSLLYGRNGRRCVVDSDPCQPETSQRSRVAVPAGANQVGRPAISLHTCDPATTDIFVTPSIGNGFKHRRSHI
jgi:hypothetical protein